MNTGSTTYFVWTTRRRPTETQAVEINREIKAIDDDMDFVGPVDIPGNAMHAWLERPNDGTNESNDQRTVNRRCIEVAERILDITD